MKYYLLFFLFIYPFNFAKSQEFVCGTNDDELSAAAKQIMDELPELIKQRKLKKSAIDDFYFCRLIVDIDSDTYKKYNNDTILIKNEVALMVQKASKIFENEIQTKLVLTYVNIWKDPSTDPYAGLSDIFKLLDKVRGNFSNNTALSKIPNDLVMYLPTKSFSGAGGVASGKFNISPWNGISTIAHELGHNFGSPHTQSCNWPGGPIDYCYAVEGSCYTDALETINGTIMSYCGRRLNTFHPLCVELMNKNASRRYQKIVKITDQIKLEENFSISSNGIFNWNNINLAEVYIIEIASDETFKNLVVRDSSQQVFATLSYLKKGQTYFLRIQPRNRLGVGQWSNTSTIKTPSNWIETPRLISPANNTIDINGTNLTFNFEALPGVTEYQLQYIAFGTNTTSHSFDSPTSTRTLTTNSSTISLSSSEAVTWRVRAKQGTEFGVWSLPFTSWLRPSSVSLDLTQQAINRYPLGFTINYSGNIGNILEVKMILSENVTYEKSIVIKSWKLSKYAGQTNYPFYFQNLKENTTYFVKFEEYNNEPQNIIGLPKGLVRFSEKSFKTGVESSPKSFNYFNNSNVENLSRTIKKVVFNEEYAFVNTNEGIVRMKLDGTESRLIQRDNSKGNISNALLDIKTDIKGDLWILTKISKRIAFNGVFPKTTYRLAKVNPTTFELLQSNDFYAANNASFSTFDTESKILANNSNVLHQILKDSTQSVYDMGANSNFSNIQWGTDNFWLLSFNSTTRNNEILNINLKANAPINFNRNNSILNTVVSQIFLDSKQTLWAINQGPTPLVKYTAETGWLPISNYNLTGSVRIVGEFNGSLYLYVVNGLNRDVFSFKNNVFRKVENIPYVNSSGNFTIDKSGRIWFWQSDKLLRINPCGYLQAPVVSSSKKQIIAGENMELKAEGCTNVLWSWNEEGKNIQTLEVKNFNRLLISPKFSTNYWAKCIDNECVSDFSNLLETNVQSLALTNLDKKKYCSNERVVYSFNINGKFDSKNEISAVFYNSKRKYTSNVNVVDGKYSSLIPKEISNDTYWIKLRTTVPEIISSDSIEVAIYQSPSVKQVSGVSEMFLQDSTKITISLIGTPPFNFKFGGENVVSNSTQITRNFYPTVPKIYSFSVSDLSDANCVSDVLVGNELNVKVSIERKYLALWVLSFPNPLNEDLNLSVYNKPGEKVSAELYDTRGILVLSKSFPIVGYFDKFRIDLSRIPGGVYSLKIDTGSRQEVRKIVKL